ncbi:AI-2E family transporter [Beijerinckia sp. L45]|uniref:AI-2E family transporter n=1 Tax=Beijerinckia sp. L45 TaxID=1641855 RepID=UPI00131DCF88|nr:AI-2E family transporter [Beijerinckia sp. L45]
MSDLIPAPRPRTQAVPDAARMLETLATLIIVVLVVGILFVAREILVPIAIAILLSFVLSPLVKLLRNIGIAKTLSVGIVVLAAFLISVGIGIVLAKQISDLAADAPKYQATVSDKVSGARTFLANNALLKKATEAMTDVSKMSPSAQADKPQPQRPNPLARTSDPAGLHSVPGGPVSVLVVEPAPGILDILQRVAGIAASPLATAAFVAIFIVFMLMQREDLRNRFIRLVGSGDLQRTTLAMNDAARRLSRYFLAQMLVNTAFGIVVAIALSIIGVPSAILWGSFAILMRFIPYIGALGAAFFPVLLAAAASPGWDMAIETALLFVVIEALVGQVVEPLVYGHNTGISPIAVVVSATFWTWLWGPVGLVLATPLTVCLVVIGRHVERLAFLDIILGDAPALTPVESFYQRVLAGDASEIADHADRYLKDHTLTEYCDNVALQALLLAQNDVRRGRLEDDRLIVIKETVDELMEDLFDREADKPESGFITVPKDDDEPIAALEKTPTGSERIRAEAPSAPIVDPAWRESMAVLCIAGRTPLDEAAAQLLADLLGKHGIGAHVEPSTSLSNNNLAHLAESHARLIVLSFLDADLSIAQARFSVRRLRRRIPNVPVVAAFWTEQDAGNRTVSLCSDVKSDLCVSTLGEAVALCLERATAPDVELAA